MTKKLAALLLICFGFSLISKPAQSQQAYPLGYEDGAYHWVIPNVGNVGRYSLVYLSAGSPDPMTSSSGLIYEVDCFSPSVNPRGLVEIQDGQVTTTLQPDEGDWVDVDAGSIMDRAIAIVCEPVLSDYEERTGN